MSADGHRWPVPPTGLLTGLLAALLLAGCGDDAMLLDVGPCQLGTNTTGVHQPAAFQPLEDGATATVELGFQGLYMVVLAFRAQDLGPSKVSVEAAIHTPEGAEVASLALKGQTLKAASDGYRYFYDLFIVTGPEVAGQQVQVAVSATDAQGGRCDLSAVIQLDEVLVE